MRIVKLDSLRGIFSLMVALHHYDMVFLPIWFYNSFIIRSSNSFVDFFFVLSGFVITSKYVGINSGKAFWAFIKKRLIRLYPLLFYTTTLYMLFQLVFNIFFPSLVGTKEGISDLLYSYLDTMSFQNSTTVFNSLYTTSVFHMGMNFPSWSISAEILTYIIFGWLMLLGAWKNWNKNWMIAILIFFAVLFCIYKGQFYFTEDYGFVRCIICFMLGYFVWVIAKYDFQIPAFVEWLIPILLLLVFLKLNRLDGYAKSMSALAVIPVFFAAAILVFVKSNGFISKVLAQKSFTFLGKISYSIYLNHILIITIVPHFMFQVLHLPVISFFQFAVMIITFMILIIYSYFTNIYIEQKMGNYLKRKFNVI
ncbi:MAG: acyltransferase [Sediminibacterium sp.]|nr:acyltransferase [Sediminibacterium sp.]